MATVIVPPCPENSFVPSGNPVIYTLATDNAFARLSYIVEVYINSNLVTTLKYPVYNRDSMNIDVTRIANDFINDRFVNDFNFSSFTNTKLFSPEECCLVYIDVYEEYYDFNTGVMTQTGPFTGDAVGVWRSAANFQDARTLFAFQDKFDLVGNTYNDFGKFFGVKNLSDDLMINMSLVPGVGAKVNSYMLNNLYKISELSERTMTFFSTSFTTGNSIHTQNLQCFVFDENGIMTKSWAKKIHQADFFINNYAKRMAQIPCSPKQLNSVVWDVGGPVDPSLQNEISYLDGDRFYFVTVCDDSYSGTIATPTMPTPSGFKWVGFEIVPCERFDVYDILYKSKDGGWWQIYTYKKSRKNINIKSNIKYNTWKTEASDTLENSARFKEVMHNDVTESFLIQTDWIKDQHEVDEIEDMLHSPNIYLIKEGFENEYIPVILSDSDYEIHNMDQDRMIRYQFNFEAAYENNTLQ